MLTFVSHDVIQIFIPINQGTAHFFLDNRSGLFVAQVVSGTKVQKHGGTPSVQGPDFGPLASEIINA
jgi:hypothetical protein